MNKAINVNAGAVLGVKKLTAVVAPGRVAPLAAPPGRQLVVLVLGVSDPGQDFDVDSMLGALGYQKGGGDGSVVT